LRFGAISQNPHRAVQHKSRVALEEDSERRCIACLHATHNRFVLKVAHLTNSE
jgi:uncharacterized protein (DUF2235 family)